MNITKAIYETSPKLEISDVHLTYLTEDDKFIIPNGMFTLSVLV